MLCDVIGLRICVWHLFIAFVPRGGSRQGGSSLSAVLIQKSSTVRGGGGLVADLLIEVLHFIKIRASMVVLEMYWSDRMGKLIHVILTNIFQENLMQVAPKWISCVFFLKKVTRLASDVCCLFLYSSREKIPCQCWTMWNSIHFFVNRFDCWLAQICLILDFVWKYNSVAFFFLQKLALATPRVWLQNVQLD